MVSMSQLEQDIVSKNSCAYGKLVEDSVNAGVEVLKAAPDLSFEFSTSAEGGLYMTGHDANAGKLLNTMNASRDHSPSFMNIAFGHLQREAIELHRPVTTKKVGGAYVVIIAPQAL